ncbi:MAG: hypothetical protein IJI08_09140, partial [Clostridia bacterium]|nr:hypothetical protein [Clostridia bacterium]
VYWTEIHKKNYEVVYAGLALYGVHWLYEICNAGIGTPHRGASSVSIDLTSGKASATGGRRSFARIP